MGKQRKQIFLISFPVLLLITSALGCTSTRSSRILDAPAGQVFLSPHPHFEEIASLKRWEASVSEFEKIQYLLERIAKTEYRFIRNGQIHDGKSARLWFLYKMSHWVEGVETVEDFVESVAAHSNKTGKPYLVEFPDGKIYSLESILWNELIAFEAHLAARHETKLTQGYPPSAPKLPLSTSVAGTAVAHSTS